MNELIINTQHHLLNLQTNGIIRLTFITEIIYLKSVGNYTSIILRDLSQYIIRKSLLNFEIELGPLFFRCHKSYMVNTLYIKEINKRRHQVILEKNETIPVSRNKSKILEEKMKMRTSLNLS